MTINYESTPQRKKDLDRMVELFTRAPWAYFSGMQLSFLIGCYPLDALLMRHLLTYEPYQERVDKWIREALLKKKHINN